MFYGILYSILGLIFFLLLGLFGYHAVYTKVYQFDIYHHNKLLPPYHIDLFNDHSSYDMIYVILFIASILTITSSILLFKYCVLYPQKRLSFNKIIILSIILSCLSTLVIPYSSFDPFFYVTIGYLFTHHLDLYNIAPDTYLTFHNNGIAYQYYNIIRLNVWKHFIVPYGPIALYFFALSYKISSLFSHSAIVNILILQTIAAILFNIITICLYKLLKYKKHNTHYTLLWCCNPLILIELVNASHVDILAFTLLIILITVSIYNKTKHTTLFIYLSMSIISLVKITFLIPQLIAIIYYFITNKTRGILLLILSIYPFAIFDISTKYNIVSSLFQRIQHSVTYEGIWSFTNSIVSIKGKQIFINKLLINSLKFFIHYGYILLAGLIIIILLSIIKLNRNKESKNIENIFIIYITSIIGFNMTLPIIYSWYIIVFPILLLIIHILKRIDKIKLIYLYTILSIWTYSLSLLYGTITSININIYRMDNPLIFIINSILKIQSRYLGCIILLSCLYNMIYLYCHEYKILHKIIKNVKILYDKILLELQIK